MSRPIDTIRLSRADTLLGTPVTQQTSLEKRNVAKHNAPTKPLSASSQIESPTHKPRIILEQQRPILQRPEHPISGASNIGRNADIRTHTDAAKTALQQPRSAQTDLTTAGKLLHDVLTKYPESAGPLQGSRPLFVSAVMLLRTNALLRMQTQPSEGQTSESTNTRTTSASANDARNNASSALSSALMQTLRSTILQSGLFYEAHLARALLGNRLDDLERLREQPQSKVHQSRTQLTPEDSDEYDEFQAVIRRQIELLNSHTIQWQGQPWPQAMMEWSLFPSNLHADHAQLLQKNEDTDNSSKHANTVSAQDEVPWCSTLHLNLPNLGEIEVEVWIHQDETKIRLVSTHHHRDLQPHINVLTQRLEQVGLQATAIEVLSETPDVALSATTASNINKDGTSRG